jgi:chromate reductase, NAD(P)H dehydrogenase (quinone)
MTKKKIFAISGSTKASSINLSLIQAIAALTVDQFDILVFDGLMQISAFSPDMDTNPPAEIIAFRNQLKAADGILICSPEYALGVPGVLKNAIDWTVASMEFSKKPTAFITAATMGSKAHQSLLDTLQIIEANVTDETQLLITNVKTKINANGKIIDEKTKLAVIQLLKALNRLIENR